MVIFEKVKEYLKQENRLKGDNLTYTQAYKFKQVLRSMISKHKSLILSDNYNYNIISLLYFYRKCDLKSKVILEIFLFIFG